MSIGATRDGLLHAWKTDGSGQMEVLPRVGVNGHPVLKIDAVIGVAGGFVVTHSSGGRLIVAHYDLDRRTCLTHNLGAANPVKQPPHPRHQWLYSFEHDSLVYIVPSEGMMPALDLATGAWFPAMSGGRAVRAQEACRAASQGRLHLRRLLIANSQAMSASQNPLGRACYFDGEQGKIDLGGMELAWESFVPLANHQPILRGAKLIEAECRGHVLAVKVCGPAPRHEMTLRLFQGPDGVALAEHKVRHSNYGFTLSSDGKLLAIQRAGWRVEVRDTVHDARLLVKTFAGGFSSETQFVLGDTWLLMRAGQRNLHLLRWDRSQLETRSWHMPSDLPDPWFDSLAVRDVLRVGLQDSPVSFSMPGVSGHFPSSLQYDSSRFVLTARTSMTAVLDRFGQFVILDAKEKLVCMVFVFRHQLSVWLPDGTCFGPASPTGRKPTAEDLEKAGRALMQATELGRTMSCK